MQVTIVNSENLMALVNSLHERIAEHNRNIHVLEKESENRSRDNLGHGDTLLERQACRAEITALRFALAQIERWSKAIEI